MDLILTEKPSVAADFAKALGATRQQGYFQNSTTAIVYCFGHMFALYQPEDYNPSDKTWAIEPLPLIPQVFKKKPLNSALAQLEIIKSLLSKSSRVILATDAGREGELIGREVLEWSAFHGQALRFWSSEALTPQVIRNNLEKLRPESDYDILYKQGLYRQIADWTTGINFTRYYSVRLGSTQSVGRVQTAILSILCRRENEVETFIPADFWTLAGTFTTGTHSFDATYYVPEKDKTLTKFTDKTRLDAATRELTPPAAAAIRTVQTQEVTENPPLLFSLTALQQEANKRHGFSSENTLKIAQRLYEEFKILSYPRTPSRVLGASSLPLVKSLIEKLSPDSSALFSNINPERVSLENKAVFDDSKLEDHHALIPLAPPPADLPVPELKIYLLVLHSFIAAFCDPARYSSTKASIEASGHLFQVSGKILLSLGWKAVYEQTPDIEEPGEDEDSQHLPDLRPGQPVTLAKLSMNKGKTTAPKRFTEAAILGVMEKPQRFFHKEFIEDATVYPGLGTPATRAEIIEKLLDRKYVERRKRLLVPTPTGRFMISTIQSGPLSPLTEPEETARWEQALAQDPAAFSTTVQDFVISAMKSLKTGASAPSLQDAPSAIGKCPKCGAPIVERKDRWVCANATTQAGSACSVSLGKVVLETRLTLADAKTLFLGKQTQMTKFTGKTGKPFDAQLKLDTSGKLEFIFKR